MFVGVLDTPLFTNYLLKILKLKNFISNIFISFYFYFGGKGQKIFTDALLRH